MALVGLKVVEFGGLAPGPFTGLVLADNGADVTRVDRPSSSFVDVLCRGKRSIAINSKLEPGRKLLEEMISSADVLIDPFRPGVLERLGLGPSVFLGDGKTKGSNEKLIFARIAGFPKSSDCPYKDMAGHDINYLAVSGILSMLPGKEKPFFPLNLVADFAGGALVCVVGILLALIERGRTGRGQIVDVDMVSGTRYLGSFPLILSHLRMAGFNGPRGTNPLDGGAPFYDTYTCRDGRWISVGCLEPHFFRVFLEIFVKALPHNFDPCQGWTPDPFTQSKRQEWSKLRQYLTTGFLTQPRDFWAKIFLGTDACALPVLSGAEASREASAIPLSRPHLSGFTREAVLDYPIINPGAHTEEILRDFGIQEERIKKLRAEGVFREDNRHRAKL